MSEVALPQVEESTPASTVDELTEKNRAIDAADDPEKPPEKPPELTAEQIRIKELEQREKRLQRGIDRKTRQLAEERAKGLTRPSIASNNGESADDSQPLTLTRAEIAQLVAREAEKLAPTLADQRTEHAKRQGVIQSLAKEWGQERFDEVASDLDEAFGGLQHADGTPKAAIEAVFEADNPQAVIEWLADPENTDEAERISKLSAVRAGREIAKLELKLAADADKAKPKISKAPAPLEPVKGSGQVAKNPETMTDKEFADWRRSQIKARR